MAERTDLICIVDDDASVLRSLTRLLTSVGLRSRAFHSPQEFVAFARSKPVFLAILDVGMPGLSGIEVLAILREMEPAPRVIMMTGSDDPTVRRSATRLGAAGFFLKPFNDEAFLNTVWSVIDAPFRPRKG